MLRALGLGDLLTAVPALRALRRAVPDHRIVLATNPVLEPLARLTGAVDAVWPAELQPLDWPAPPPDVAVNLHGSGPESHRVLLRLAPGRLVAFGCPPAGVTGPPWDGAEHEVRRWCRLVEWGFRVPAPASDLRLAVPDVRPPVRGAVVIHPGAAYGSRRWPAERFAAVASDCATRAEVVVTGSRDERRLAESVCRRAGLSGTACLAGRTPIAELAALVAAATLVVSGDTGVAHLATAYGTPSVVLFGPTPPALWGPVVPGPHVVLWHGYEGLLDPGDPTGSSVHPLLDAISVAEVLDVTRRMLAAPAGEPVAGLGRPRPAS